MSPDTRRLLILPTASRSVDSQADYYASVSNSNLHERWSAAIDEALASLLTVPEGGSLCGFKGQDIADLRRRPIKGFRNHLILYRFVANNNTLVIVNIVHGSRDLPV